MIFVAGSGYGHIMCAGNGGGREINFFVVSQCGIHAFPLTADRIEDTGFNRQVDATQPFSSSTCMTSRPRRNLSGPSPRGLRMQVAAPLQLLFGEPDDGESYVFAASSATMANVHSSVCVA